MCSSVWLLKSNETVRIMLAIGGHSCNAGVCLSSKLCVSFEYNEQKEVLL